MPDWTTWEWKPEPADLLAIWQSRARDFGLEPGQITTRQGISQFQKRRDWGLYRPAVKLEVSWGASATRQSPGEVTQAKSEPSRPSCDAELLEGKSQNHRSYDAQR